MSTTTSITNLIKSPRRIAQALDWHKASGSVLNVTIRKEQIDIRVALHPSLGKSPRYIPSIPLQHNSINNRKTLKPEVSHALAQVVRQFRVCGMIVNWPIQKDGWCGASCGRVLHTLSELHHSSPVLAKKPFCLWDSGSSVGHYDHPSDDDRTVYSEDRWGRSAIYCRENPNKSIHIASKEQYDCGESAALERVWTNFCKANWPELLHDEAFFEFSQKDLSDEMERKLNYA